MRGLSVLLLLIALPAAAQTPGIFPSHPVAGQEVLFYVEVPNNCWTFDPPVMSGNTITVTARAFPILCSPTAIVLPARLGTFAPGTYTVNVVNADTGTVMATATFDVHANVPALGYRGVGILVIAIATAAFLALRRPMP